jgi:hypothetical protein
MSNSQPDARISWQQFIDRYRPVSAGIREGNPGIPMFETFGQDLRTVCRTQEQHVWTFIDMGLANLCSVPKDEDGDECWLLVAGYHRVNRLGYVITEVAWECDCLEVLY